MLIAFLYILQDQKAEQIIEVKPYGNVIPTQICVLNVANTFIIYNLL